MLTKPTIIRYFIVFAFIASSETTKAQSLNTVHYKKLFRAWGLSPLLGFYSTPPTPYPDYEPVYNGSWFTNSFSNNGNVQYIYSTWDILAFLYVIRYNVKTLDPNHSISLCTIPSIGIGQSQLNHFDVSASGWGSINIPLFLEFNIGNIHNYKSEKDEGFILGIGLEYTKAPLFYQPVEGIRIDAQGDLGSYTFTTGWIEPVIEISKTHFNKWNKLREVNLKVGVSTNGAYNVRLSWIKWLWP